MRPPREPDLELRGKPIRSLGAFREMLPGLLFDPQTPAAGPTVIAPTAKSCTSQYQISILIDGKPQALNIWRNGGQGAPKDWRCADALMPPPPPSAASTSSGFSKRSSKKRKIAKLERHRHRFEAYLDKVFGFSDLGERSARGTAVSSTLEKGV